MAVVFSRKIYLALVMALIPVLVQSQTTKADSLSLLFHSSTQDQRKAALALTLANYYASSIPDSAYVFADFVIKYGERTQDSCLIGSGLFEKYLVDYRTGKLRVALPEFEKAYKLMSHCSEGSESQIRATSKLGFFYLEKGDYLLAQEYFYQVLNKSIKYRNKLTEAEVECYLSILYRMFELNEEALEFSKSAVANARKASDVKLQTFALRVTGELLMANNKRDEAQKHFDLS